MVVECSPALYLPSRLVEKRISDKEILKARFKKELEAFVNEHSSHKEPYFILIKANPDRKSANITRQAMTFYAKRPPFITRTMVFFVDNSRGLLTWLWRVTPEKEIVFNKPFALRCQELLRVGCAAG